MAGAELAGTDPYSRGTPCPKCGYVRTAADANPAWQCPKCLIAYRKFQPPGRPVAARLVAGTRDLAADSSSDHSVYSLVAANLFTMTVAVFSGMTLRDLLAVYWAQSVVIGVCYFIRILVLHKFTVDEPPDDSLPWYRNMGDPEGRDWSATIASGVDPDKPWSKTGFAFFFLAHYGFFHFVYLMFLVEPRSAQHNLSTLALCVLGFAIHHAFSLAHNIRADRIGTPNLNTMAALPYYRIIPMHATIIAGGLMRSGTGYLLLFVALKILADVVMHTIEHRRLRGSAPPPWAT